MVSPHRQALTISSLKIPGSDFDCDVALLELRALDLAKQFTCSAQVYIGPVLVVHKRLVPVKTRIYMFGDICTYVSSVFTLSAQ